MGKRTVITTILIQTFCWAIIGLILAQEKPLPVNALVQTAAPQPFLGPVYYGREDVWQVFDHNLPCASVCDDDIPPPPQGTPTNVYVIHYDGSRHDPITPIPQGDPYIPGGFGYDEHGGIDYSLEYEPVLASASGIVDYANWHVSSNHRSGYGLYVILDHTDTDYQTFYAHLSVLAVQVGDEITINSNDPGNRNHILGISGNTGAVLGSCGPVSGDPNCGQHLHFEVRRRNQVYGVVNPYGWVAPPGTVDPWANYNPPTPTPHGATSYDLWLDYPALVSEADQYLGIDSTPILEPAVNNARMIIDDTSADFTKLLASCWTEDTGGNSYNGNYHWAETDPGTACFAQWNIRPDAFTPAGAYDVFVRIPEGENRTWGAAYTIKHQNNTHVAIVAQAAYPNPNTEQNAWVYVGRYDFAMSDLVEEYVRLSGHTTIEDDQGRVVMADAIMLAPADEEAILPQRFIYVSFEEAGVAGNVPYEDEDILLFDAATSEWRMFFDGSDVGLAGVGIDAFDFRSGHLFFSLNAPLGSSYTASDIIRFVPASLGEDTSGTMSVYIPGEKLGLIPAEFPGENIDALTFNDQGKIVLSTQGQAEIGPDIFEDEDLFINDSDTSASLFFDGSEYALNEATENVNGVWVGTAGRIYLSTTGSFAVPDVSGDGADIFICAPGIFQNCWFEPGLFWNGSAHGIPNMSIDDFYLGGYIPLPGECGNLPLNCSFEDQFAHWTVVAPNPQNENWLPTISETHSGWYSAMGEITSGVPDTTLLNSSPITLQPIGIEYRFSFYGKAFNTSPESVVIGVVVYWGDNNGNLDGGGKLIGVVSGIHTEWTLFTTPFVCMPWWGNSAEFSFHVTGEHFVQGEGYLPENVERFFIDDVRVESRPNANCPTLNSGGN